MGLLNHSFYFLLVVLLWLIAHRKLVKKNLKLKEQLKAEQILRLQQLLEHQQVFRTMISKIHHRGVVPISASALGLMYVISLVVSQCIKSLLKLQHEQDWKTHTVTSELSRMLIDEVTLLELKLKELNMEVKNNANEYHKYTDDFEA